MLTPGMRMTQEASDPRFGIHLVCITHSVHFSYRTHSSLHTVPTFHTIPTFHTVPTLHTVPTFQTLSTFHRMRTFQTLARFQTLPSFPSYRTDRTHITAPSLAEEHQVPFLSGGHAEPRLTFRGLCVIAPPMSLLFWIKRNAKTKTRKDLTNLPEPFHLPLALCHFASAALLLLDKKETPKLKNKSCVVQNYFPWALCHCSCTPQVLLLLDKTQKQRQGKEEIDHFCTLTFLGFCIKLPQLAA